MTALDWNGGRADSAPSWTLADLTLPREAAPAAVVDHVRRLGAAVMPEFASAADLAGLREDFRRVLADRSEAYIYPIGYAPGAAVSITRGPAFAAAYPRTEAFFTQDFMHRVVQAYIGVPHLLNHELYATHEFRPDTDIAPTHFDKLWTLKFMLYLNDVGRPEGAFGVIPGSAARSRAIFRQIYDRNGLRYLAMDDNRYQRMENAWIGADSLVIDIVAPAGTLIVFDTDTCHHAGQVEPGHERMILRAHSGPAAVYRRVRRGGRQWDRGEQAWTRWDDLRDRLAERWDRLRGVDR